MENRKKEIAKAIANVRKSNPKYSKKNLGGKLKDLISDMNLRSSNEDGVTKFEGGNGDLTFEGTAEKNEINMTGQYKGIDFFVILNYEQFVQNIYDKISNKVKETAEDLNIDKETVHDMAVGLLATIAKEEGITEEEIEEAIEDDEETHEEEEYNTLVQYKNTEGTITTFSDIVDATSKKDAERQAEEKVRGLDNFIEIDNIKVDKRSEETEETEEELVEEETRAKGGKAGKSKTKTITVFSFDDLSENAKEKALEKYRDVNVEDNYWTEGVYESWKDKLEKMGWGDVEINYSGFWSQGDGASFTTERIDLKKLMKHFKLDKKYPLVFDNYDEITGYVNRSGNYVHERSTTLHLDTSRNPEGVDEKEFDGQLDDLDKELSKEMVRITQSL